MARRSVCTGQGAAQTGATSPVVGTAEINTPVAFHRLPLDVEGRDVFWSTCVCVVVVAALWSCQLVCEWCSNVLRMFKGVYLYLSIVLIYMSSGVRVVISKISARSCGYSAVLYMSELAPFYQQHVLQLLPQCYIDSARPQWLLGLALGYNGTHWYQMVEFPTLLSLQ